MRVLALVSLLLPALAFGQAEIRSITSSSTDSVSVTHNIIQPSPIEAGDLVIVCATIDGANANMTYTWPMGLTSFSDENQGSMRTDCAWYEADGTEDGSTITWTSDEAETTAHFSVALCETADPGTSPPESAEANGVSTAPNPPSLTPSGGSAAYYWLSVIGTEGNEITAFPSGYSNTGQKVSGAAIPRVGWGFRANTATSEDPAAGTLSSADQWTAHTIAIYPGSNSTCSAGGGSGVELFRRQGR